MFQSKVSTVTKIVVAFFLVSVSNAQVIDFDLSEYTPPEFKRHSLDAGFNLSGQHNFTDRLTESVLTESDFDNESDYFTSQGYADYSYMRYRNNIQREFYGVFSAYHNYASSDNYEKTEQYTAITEIDNKSEQTSFSPSFSFSGDNRYYPNNSNLFVETNGYLFIGMSFNNSDRVNSSLRSDEFPYENEDPYDYKKSYYTDSYRLKAENKYINFGINFRPEFILGLGRIDNVSDARLAIYIFQDLQDKNCLSKLPVKDDIIKLAELITEIKNERFFDAREKKITDITRVDAFLKENGFVKENGAAYFTSINDNWDYASQNRTSGYRISAGVIPEYSFNKNNTESDRISNSDSYDLDEFYLDSVAVETYESEDFLKSIVADYRISTSSQIGLFGKITFVHEKPFNLYWQGNFSSTLLYGKRNYDIETEIDNSIAITHLQVNSSGAITDSTLTISEADTKYTNKEKFKYDYFQAQLSYKLYYFPNTRTDMSIELRGIYSLQNGIVEDHNDVKTDFEYDKLDLSLYLNANYYFSPQLRLSGLVNYSYSLALDDYDPESYNYSDIDNEICRLLYRLSLKYYIF